MSLAIPFSSYPIATFPIQRAWAALEARQYFKFIAGGSFTDAPAVTALCWLYAMAGADCLDIAPDPIVVNAVCAMLDRLPDEVLAPLLMVSIGLDDDPHFRKIRLEAENCTGCDACIPVCPTGVFTHPETHLTVEEPLCYGCGRCVPVCPTEALVFEPLPSLSQPIQAILQNPRVQAVELHTQSLDLNALTVFLQTSGHLLEHKLVSLCFRPDERVDKAQEAEYLRTLTRFLKVQKALFMLQIDGKPMSGSNADPLASLPALEAARRFQERSESFWPVTISGGINAITATYLQTPPYQGIQGVGMGSSAREVVWSRVASIDAMACLEAKNWDCLASAIPTAQSMVQGFKMR